MLRKLKYSLKIRLNDLKMRISTDNPMVFNYLSKNFRPVILKDGIPDIEVKFHYSYYWYKKRRFDTSRFMRIDKRIYRGTKEIFWETLLGFPDLSLLIKAGSHGPEVVLFYQLNLFKALYHMAVRGGAFRSVVERYINGLIYYGINYPCLWKLKRKGVHFLHASSIQFHGKTILIAGFAGIGKTALSINLCSGDGCRFLSDNIVLYDRKHLYPFFEPVMIRKGDFAPGAIRAEQFRELGLRKGERAFYSYEGFEDKAYPPPDYVLVPVFSDKGEVKILDTSEAVKVLLASTDFAGELSSFRQYQQLMDFLYPGGEEGAETDVLKETLKNSRCYLVHMDHKKGINGALDMLRPVLSG